MKGFKICLDGNRNIRKGIAASSLIDLKAKIEAKFEVGISYLCLLWIKVHILRFKICFNIKKPILQYCHIFSWSPKVRNPHDGAVLLENLQTKRYKEDLMDIIYF